MNSHKKVNENKLKKISKNYYHVDFPNMTPKERLEKLLNIPDHKSDNFFRTQRIINSLQKTQIKKNILDIGAGTGFFIYKLINSKFKNKNKWSFFSHETDKECVKLLKTIKKNNLVNKNFLNLKKKYHYITLNKVLEHIPQPINFLKKIKKILHIDGIIYIEVPHTSNKIRKYDPSFGSLHWNMYSKYSFKVISQILNLKIINIQIIKEPSNKKTIFCMMKNN